MTPPSPATPVSPSFENPFRPGAGHSPPFLAGRDRETEVCRRLLTQRVILDNLVLTGLRGVGKTVFLRAVKPLALRAGWRWIDADLSESASLSEEAIAVRLLADLSLVTAGLAVDGREERGIGFTAGAGARPLALDYRALSARYLDTPGLPHDKLRAVLELAWTALRPTGAAGVVFCYDEAQNLSDHAEKGQYPLSLLLDVFQRIQSRAMPFMLFLSGPPTLFPKLTEARTYAERMFHVVNLDRLNEAESREALVRPLDPADCPVRFDEGLVARVCALSAGYPYFIQFIGREMYDALLQNRNPGIAPDAVPVDAVLAKLDNDFFLGRWNRVTARQRLLLHVAAHLENAAEAFSGDEVAALSAKMLKKAFRASHVNQVFSALCHVGVLYRNRQGKYAFAIPRFDDFIRRQNLEDDSSAA